MISTVPGPRTWCAPSAPIGKQHDIARPKDALPAGSRRVGVPETTTSHSSIA